MVEGLGHDELVVVELRLAADAEYLLLHTAGWWRLMVHPAQSNTILQAQHSVIYSNPKDWY